MNQGTKESNKSVKATKETLSDHLNNVGLKTDDSFKRARTAYNSLFAAKRVKADLDKWHSIGSFFFDVKESMSENNIGMNTGHMTKIQRTYFKELTAQDVSNAVWLHKHFPNVKEWIQVNKRNLSNPASIKQAIRKQLVESKADNAEFTNFGFEPPKPSEPKQPDGKDKNNQRKNNTTIDDNLKHLELIASQLAKFKTGSWTMAQFKRFELASQKIADFYVDLDEKLSKAKIVKVDDNTAKKVASK